MLCHLVNATLDHTLGGVRWTKELENAELLHILEPKIALHALSAAKSCVRARHLSNVCLLRSIQFHLSMHLRHKKTCLFKELTLFLTSALMKFTFPVDWKSHVK